MSPIHLPSVEPMHATQVTRPFQREGWVYEEKVDGWRMLAFKHGTEVRLVSRNGRDHTKRFPDLADEIRGLDVSVLILDGEVAVFNSKLCPLRVASAASASRGIHAARLHRVRLLGDRQNGHP